MRFLSYNFWPVKVGAEVVGTDSSHKQKLAPSGTTVTLPPTKSRLFILWSAYFQAKICIIFELIRDHVFLRGAS